MAPPYSSNEPMDMTISDHDPIIAKLAETQALQQQESSTTAGMSVVAASVTANHPIHHHHPSIPRRSILKCNNDGTASTTASTVASGRAGGKEVSFESIRIQKYPMVLGDNPACTIGAPVSLDWEHEEEEVYDIDVYECERRPRRTLRYLVLSYYRRQDILRRAGYEDGELKSAARKIQKVRRQRAVTGTLLPLGKLEEAMTSAGRKIKRASSGGSKKCKAAQPSSSLSASSSGCRQMTSV